MDYETELKFLKGDMLKEEEHIFIAELNVASCIKHNRNHLSLENLAKVLTETLAPEELKSLMQEFQKYDIK